MLDTFLVLKYFNYIKKFDVHHHALQIFTFFLKFFY